MSSVYVQTWTYCPLVYWRIFKFGKMRIFICSSGLSLKKINPKKWVVTLQSMYRCKTQCEIVKQLSLYIFFLIWIFLFLHWYWKIETEKKNCLQVYCIHIPYIKFNCFMFLHTEQWLLLHKWDSFLNIKLPFWFIWYFYCVILRSSKM